MAEAAEKYYPRQKSEDWYQTPSGDSRGYIDSGDLRELWFHTGTACNLACDFCLEGSKPGDRRLQLIRFADAKPAILAALKLGVEQFSFTGGEPFVARDIVRILMLACSHRPCLLLTNGTLALQRRKAELWPLLSNPYPVSFRVSLDHYDADIHDRGRGAGNFISALRGLKMLYDMGFPVSVARRIWPDEDKKATAAAFAKLFTDHDLPPDITLVAFPDFAPPGAVAAVPAITTDCMSRHHSAESQRNFMCGFSRMMVKQNGAMRVYACTLVDDDPDYDLGASLAGSMQERISLKHHRCYSCFAYGASCSEL